MDQDSEDEVSRTLTLSDTSGVKREHTRFDLRQTPTEVTATALESKNPRLVYALWAWSRVGVRGWESEGRQPWEIHFMKHEGPGATASHLRALDAYLSAHPGAKWSES